MAIFRKAAASNTNWSTLSAWRQDGVAATRLPEYQDTLELNNFNITSSPSISITSALPRTGPDSSFPQLIKVEDVTTPSHYWQITSNTSWALSGNTTIQTTRSTDPTDNGHYVMVLGTSSPSAIISGGYAITKTGNGMLVIGDLSGAGVSNYHTFQDSSGVSIYHNAGWIAPVYASSTVNSVMGTGKIEFNNLSGSSSYGIVSVASSNTYYVTNPITAKTSFTVGMSASDVRLVFSGGMEFGSFSPTINTVAVATISGAMTGTNGFTKDGSSTLTISVANPDLKGIVTVNAGSMALTDLNALQNATYSTDGNGGLGGSTSGIVFGNLISTINKGVNFSTLSFTTGYVNEDAHYASYYSTGSFTITKVGTGKWFLNNTTNAGTRTGITTINGGSVVIKRGDTLGTGAITVNSGGCLDLDGSSADITAVANTITLNGEGNTADGENRGAIRSISGNNSKSTLALGSSSTISVTSGTFTLASSITGSTADLSKRGAGELVLGGTGTITGTLRIYGGKITTTGTNALYQMTMEYLSTYGGIISFGSLSSATLANITGNKALVLENQSNAAVNLNLGGRNGSAEYSGNFSGSGSITKAGTGTLTLSGTNSFTGLLNVTAGTVLFTSSGSIPSDTTNHLLITALVSAGTSSSPAIEFGPTNITVSKKIRIDYGTVNNGIGYLNTNGDINNNHTATIDGDLELFGPSAITPIIGKDGLGTLKLNGNITAAVTATRFSTGSVTDTSGKSIINIPDLSKLSTNINFVFYYGLILETSSSEYTKSFGNVANTFRTTSTTGTGGGGGFSSSSVGGLNFRSSITFTNALASGLTSWYGPFYLGNSYGTSVGKVTLSGNYSAGFAQVIHVNNITGGTVAGEITGTFTGTGGGITKQGPGRLQLSSSLTFSGALTVSSGTVLLSNLGNLTAASGITVSSGAVLELDSLSASITRPLTLAGNGIGSSGALINLSGNSSATSTVTLTGNTTIAVNSASLSLTGAVSGTNFSITKIGKL